MLPCGPPPSMHAQELSSSARGPEGGARGGGEAELLGEPPSPPRGRDLALVLGANSYGNPSQDPAAAAAK